MGLTSAVVMRDAAYLGSWALCLSDVKTWIGCSTEEEFAQRLPRLGGALAAVSGRLEAAGVPKVRASLRKAFFDPLPKA